MGSGLVNNFQADIRSVLPDTEHPSCRLRLLEGGSPIDVFSHKPGVTGIGSSDSTMEAPAKITSLFCNSL